MCRFNVIIILLHLTCLVRADHCPFDRNVFVQLVHDRLRIEHYLDSLLLLPLSQECEYRVLIGKHVSSFVHGTEDELVFESFNELVNRDVARDYPEQTLKLQRLHCGFLVNNGYYSKAKFLVDSLLVSKNIDPSEEIMLLNIRARLLIEEKKGIPALNLLRDIDRRLQSNPELASPGLAIEIYHKFAILFLASGNYEQALDYYDKAIKLSKKEKIKSGLAHYFVNSAYCYGALGNLTEGKCMMDSAKVYLKENPFYKEYPVYYLTKATFLAEECFFDSSQQFVHLAIEAMVENRSDLDLERAYRISINNKLALNEIQGYTEIIEKIEACCSEIVSKNDSLFFLLLKILDKIPESQVSLKLEMLKPIKSLKNYEIQTIEDKLRKALVKYEAEKKEAENLLLKNQTELNKAIIQNQRFYILTLVLGLLALWLLLNTYLKRYKEKKRHLSQLHAKNRVIESLNKEINHRTKNHLALATSLLSKSRMETTDENIRHIIRDNENKLRTLVLINQKLSSNPEDENLNLKSYLIELCEDLIFSFQNSLMRKIDFKLMADDLLLDSEFCLRLGLLSNELITNSVKHAQTDGLPLEILLSISQERRTITYSYTDNGSGADLSSKNQGLELVSQLVEQLDGKFQHLVNGVYRFQAEFDYPNTEMLN